MNFTIHPYRSRTYGWTFLDPTTNRAEDENALVAGMDIMLDGIERTIGDFSITFSDVELDIDHVHLIKLIWTRGDKTNASECVGNFYMDEESGIEGWLCPVLFDYFKVAPDTLYLYILLRK